MPATHVHVQARGQVAGLRSFLSHRAVPSHDQSTGRQAQSGARMGVLVCAVRLVGVAATLWYVVISLQAVFAAISVLRGLDRHVASPDVYTASLIAGYTGKGTLASSPLVRDVLGGVTTPRSDTLYLETASSHSFTGCSAVEDFNKKLYNGTFLSYLFDELQEDTAYNISLMNDVELVMPVVDCSYYGLVIDNNNVVRVYYLVRQVSDPGVLYLLSTTMVSQNYYVEQQYQRGAALFTTIAIISDMGASSVDYHLAIAPNYPYESDPDFVVCEFVEITSDGFWFVREVPANPLTDPPRDILTAWREGFYIKDSSAQANIKNWYWELSATPMLEVSAQTWRAQTVQRDTWAWAHGIHIFFALDGAFQLSALLFVVYRGFFHHGCVWIGDSFAPISSSLMYRGVLVFISNAVDNFFTWTEYSLAIGYPLAGYAGIFYRPELLQADLLTFYLNVATFLSYATSERLEPAVVVGSFIMGYQFREQEAANFPAAYSTLVAFAKRDNALGEIHGGTFLDSLSPFAFRTVHEVDRSNRDSAMLGAIASIFVAMIWVALFIITQKARRRWTTRKMTRAARRRSSGSVKLPLLLFESATGAKLQKKFGVLASYDNYVDIGGRRYASADAVYSNGFVIANKKFVIAIGDLLTILGMKIIRMRFANVFVYELIDGETMKQTARLVYPSTISWTDLFHLGVSHLG